MSAEIPVIQFLRPDAQKRHLLVEVSDAAGQRWKEEIESLGLRLTAEVIPGEPDQVCVCLENPDLGDYRVALAPNTPDSPIVREVEALLLEFDPLDYDAWRRSLLEGED